MAKPEFAFLKDLNLSDGVQVRLSQSLNRIITGSSDDQRTPFMRGASSEDILREFDDFFERQSGTLDDNLLKLEMHNRSKFGPRSVAKPWSERRKDVEAYFAGYQGKKEYVHVVNPHDHTGLRPLDNVVAGRLLKANTSSGLPFLEKKKVHRDEVSHNLMYYLNRRDPCVLFTRTEDSGKTRTVWGYPIADTLQELRFYAVYVAKAKTLGWRSALKGPEAVNARVSQLFDHARETGNVLAGVDFSAYDAHVQGPLHDNSWNYITNHFQTQFWEVMDEMDTRFRTIGLVTPDGVKSGEHGVPSGSVWTNERDSVAQYIMVQSNPVLHDVLGDIQGDDGAYSINPSKVDTLYENFEDWGMELNRDKVTLSSTHLVYLQNYYSDSYTSCGRRVGVYPLYRALERIVHQSRWSAFEDEGLKGQDYYSLRAISILENCRHHPYFKAFVKFVAARDKYGLRYSAKGRTKYLRYERESKGSVDVAFHQPGDNMRGLESFQTIATLKGLE